MRYLAALLLTGFGSAVNADEVVPPDLPAANELLIDDFENPKYSGWTVAGEAFGPGPVATTREEGRFYNFRGQRLVNSFHGGDPATGSLTSEEFTIQRRHIAFLIAGGRHAGQTGIELRVDGEAVRRATGHDSGELEWQSWDVTDLRGQPARLRIFDEATGGWGHINVDHIVQTDVAPHRFDLQHQLSEYRRSADYLNEPWRPQYHFSPEVNWMNDPNGLVYHDGEYHLFYQYNPAGNSWGHMSWGHAVSPDLTHWQHLPVAIYEEDGVMAFSGCCVVDHRNTSGFGRDGQPAMVAVYTGHGHGKQVQNLAYSNDNGRTWTKYAENPVLDLNEQDFRDPKVFWHEPTSRWVMVVSLANAKVLIFYASADLKTWTELSRFGPAGAPDKPNWECPDLFELPVENEAGRRLWVLEVDMGNGAIAGGSGGEYFVGHFDGTKFESVQPAAWVDFGRDFYAPVSWSDIPDSDGRRIWIGWFNNWETSLLPTSPWRSAMSVPRTLSLRKVDDQYVLIQRPVQELQQLRGAGQQVSAVAVSDEVRPAPLTLSQNVYELQFELQPDAQTSGVRVCVGDGQFTEIGYDRSLAGVYVDRRQSGNVEFDPRFPGRHIAPLTLTQEPLRLRILVDRSSVEVFVNDGQVVLSDRIFPAQTATAIQFFASDGSARFSQIQAWPLQSVWRK